MPDQHEETKWHLDRRIPLAIIATLLVQTFGIGWYAASQSARTDANTARIDSFERSLSALTPRFESVIRLEAKLDSLQASFLDLKTAITARTATQDQQQNPQRR